MKTTPELTAMSSSVCNALSAIMKLKFKVEPCSIQCTLGVHFRLGGKCISGCVFLFNQGGCCYENHYKSPGEILSNEGN